VTPKCQKGLAIDVEAARESLKETTVNKVIGKREQKFFFYKILVRRESARIWAQAPPPARRQGHCTKQKLSCKKSQY
jgi:hypothetical protein